MKWQRGNLVLGLGACFLPSAQVPVVFLLRHRTNAIDCSYRAAKGESHRDVQGLWKLPPMRCTRSRVAPSCEHAVTPLFSEGGED